MPKKNPPKTEDGKRVSTGTPEASLYSRRAWMGAAAIATVSATGLGSSDVLALGKSSEVSAGQIRSPGEKNFRGAALSRLFWDASKRTAINFSSSPVDVNLERGKELYRQPFLSWSGEKAFAPLSSRARQRLSRHLRFGGMLWIDAPDANGPFLKSVLAEVDAILPTSPLEPLPKDHVLFKSFFLIKGAVGRTTAKGDGGATGVLAASISGRLVVVITVCDALGAYERDQFGTWQFACQPDGESQREQALRFGANVVMYATCLDYKADQVHIPFILKKRRR